VQSITPVTKLATTDSGSTTSTRKDIECIVVNPADVPTKDKKRKEKRDPVDCRKLPRSLRNGEIEGLYVSTRIKIEDRSLLRTRRNMVKKQTRCKNQIKSMLAFYAIHLPTDIVNRNWSGKIIKWLEDIRMEKASGNVAFKVHLHILHHMRGIIVELKRNIRARTRTDEYRANAKLLKSVTGISSLTAMTFLTELCTLDQFGSLDKLAIYIGFIPDMDSSGEKDTTTGNTDRRNRILRHLIIESAWIGVQKVPALLMTFERFSKKMKKNKSHRSHRQKAIEPHQIRPEESAGVCVCGHTIRNGITLERLDLKI